jgi:hypothetical protein
MYGQESYTDKCVDVTIQNAGVDVDIIVVDDGSKLPYKNDKVEVCRLSENSGFTQATNTGILKALDGKYDYVHLLNNDTEPYPNFIKVLLDVMEKSPNIGIASSIRYYPIEDPYYEYFGADLISGYQMICKEASVIPGEVIHCNWVPVCSSLLSVEMIKYLGLFNRKMRNHSSDVEYCLRAKIAGYKIVVCTDSRVLHYHEVTTKSNNQTPYPDQAEWLRILSNVYYAEFMKAMPLDTGSKLWGKLEFSTYNQ